MIACVAMDQGGASALNWEIPTCIRPVMQCRIFILWATTMRLGDPT